jgi:hypothetical protein
MVRGEGVKASGYAVRYARATPRQVKALEVQDDTRETGNGKTSKRESVRA